MTQSLEQNAWTQTYLVTLHDIWFFVGFMGETPSGLKNFWTTHTHGSWI